MSFWNFNKGCTVHIFAYFWYLPQKRVLALWLHDASSVDCWNTQDSDLYISCKISSTSAAILSLAPNSEIPSNEDKWGPEYQLSTKVLLGLEETGFKIRWLGKKVKLTWHEGLSVNHAAHLLLIVKAPFRLAEKVEKTWSIMLVFWLMATSWKAGQQINLLV